jgi:hypothetical protein
MQDPIQNPINSRAIQLQLMLRCDFTRVWGASAEWFNTTPKLDLAIKLAQAALSDLAMLVKLNPGGFLLVFSRFLFVATA